MKKIPEQVEEEIYTDEEVKRISEENPDKIFEGSDGRIVYQGIIFKNKQEAAQVFDLYFKTMRFLSKIKRLFFIKKITGKYTVKQIRIVASR